MKTPEFELLEEDAELSITAAEYHDITYPQRYREIIDVIVKIAFGADTKSAIFYLQGSYDGTTWFNLVCQNMASATLAFITSLTMTSDAAQTILRCNTAFPQLRVKTDATASSNKPTVTIAVSGH